MADGNPESNIIPEELDSSIAESALSAAIENAGTTLKFLLAHLTTENAQIQDYCETRAEAAYEALRAAAIKYKNTITKGE